MQPTAALRTSDATITGEAPAEWDRFRDQIVASLTPTDPLEAELAVRVAVSLWRRRRAGALESVHLWEVPAHRRTIGVLGGRGDRRDRRTRVSSSRLAATRARMAFCGP